MRTSYLVSAVAFAVLWAYSANARDAITDTRKAIVLDFTATSAERLEARDRSPVSSAMVSDFASVQTQASSHFPPRRQTGADQTNTPFVRTPAIVVPGWMRGERGLLALQAMPTSLPTIGDCGARSYSTSGLLKASGEARRRILYPLIVQSACRYGIPVGLFDAMIIQESRYNAAAVSRKGAFGLGQLMPGTAIQLGVDRYNIYENLEGAARYLAAHLREFREPSLALAAYNAGPGRVRSSLTVPRITETQGYVREILTNWRTLEWRANLRPRPAKADE